MKLNALFVRSLVGASLLAGATLLPATSALAQQADQGYVTLPAAQPSDSVGKTEVLEFFSYSCPHCAILEPKVEAWSKTLPDNVVLRRVPVAFNAGMYDLNKPLISRAYLQNGKHFNNGQLLEDFNLMMALGPKPKCQRSNIEVLDLTCANWEQEKNNFTGFAQGLRMIDCNASPMYWQKKIQSCSMLVAAEDEKGWFYLIFTRSPYTHNQMIDFMKQMPGGLHDAIYLEGGPETSLLIKVNGHLIKKVGSWVSTTWESDANKHFWPLPNIIGIRKAS